MNTTTQRRKRGRRMGRRRVAAPTAERSILNAREAGKKCGLSLSGAVEDNPYKRKSKEFYAWQEGWLEGIATWAETRND